ncbi:MAG: LemA family protein [Bacteroidetes bacterium]|nr:LemA family protein [Bacteroidota bacterium]MCY4225618.1 LemA family protein [Bacteroidota bacterium]
MRNTSTIILIIVVVVLGFAGCASCGTYNNLIGQEEAVEEAWGNVQTAYQRRADLIPNLVNTVQAAGDFEQETLQAVTEARARATSINVSADDLRDPSSLAQFQQAQSQLSGALGRLLVVSENYPQLRATDGFRDLQVQLEGTENRINTARTRYNGVVRQYNTAIRTFPAAMFAGIFGHSRRSPFEAESGAQNAPEVNFDS